MKGYTVKEIAELLSVSKPTVQRAIKAASIKADKLEGQTQIYSYESAVAIIEKIKPEFRLWEQTATPPHEPEHEPEQTATPPHEPEHEPEQTATPPHSETELLRDMLETIKEQLAIKDAQIKAYEAQIAAQNKQIQDYSERLKEAMMLTHGQQYIAAADKTVNLIAASKPSTNLEDKPTITPEEQVNNARTSNFFTALIKKISKRKYD